MLKDEKTVFKPALPAVPPKFTCSLAGRAAGLPASMRARMAPGAHSAGEVAEISDMLQDPNPSVRVDACVRFRELRQARFIASVRFRELRQDSTRFISVCLTFLSQAACAYPRRSIQSWTCYEGSDH